MSFIDDLKKEENIYNHSIEDIIILKYIESFKRYLKWNFQYIDKSTEIHGYVKNNRDIYGFKFVKEKLYGQPKCNRFFSDECSCITYFSEMQGCRIKEFANYDYLYLKDELKKN